MTETQQFIEDAVSGGYVEKLGYTSHVYQGGEYLDLYNGQSAGRRAFTYMLLDPLAWQAVGRTRGWLSEASGFYDTIAWQEYWHCFIDHLANGKSIEDALLAIK